jgi:hypothetical protein
VVVACRFNLREQREREGWESGIALEEQLLCSVQGQQAAGENVRASREARTREQVDNFVCGRLCSRWTVQIGRYKFINDVDRARHDKL